MSLFARLSLSKGTKSESDIAVLRSTYIDGATAVANSYVHSHPVHCKAPASPEPNIVNPQLAYDNTLMMTDDAVPSAVSPSSMQHGGAFDPENPVNTQEATDYVCPTPTLPIKHATPRDSGYICPTPTMPVKQIAPPDVTNMSSTTEQDDVYLTLGSRASDPAGVAHNDAYVALRADATRDVSDNEQDLSPQERQ